MLTDYSMILKVSRELVHALPDTVRRQHTSRRLKPVRATAKTAVLMASVDCLPWSPYIDHLQAYLSLCT
jgi:hypothetical protein